MDAHGANTTLKVKIFHVVSNENNFLTYEYDMFAFPPFVYT